MIETTPPCHLSSPVALARALDELGRPSVYTEFDLFKHVDPVQPLEPTKMVGEISRLYWHIYSFLGVIA